MAAAPIKKFTEAMPADLYVACDWTWDPASITAAEVQSSSACFYFPDASTAEAYLDDPCLAYYDEARTVCALCKHNSVRIAMPGQGYALCGTTDFDPADATHAAQVHQGTYSCNLDPYYFQASKFPALDGVDFQFEPKHTYFNQTRGTSETICVSQLDFAQSECLDTAVNLSSDDQALLSTDALLIERITFGCRRCDAQVARPSVRTDSATGMAIQYCRTFGEIKYELGILEREGVPCDAIGYLSKYEGFIEEE